MYVFFKSIYIMILVIFVFSLFLNNNLLKDFPTMEFAISGILFAIKLDMKDIAI